MKILITTSVLLALFSMTMIKSFADGSNRDIIVGKLAARESLTDDEFNEYIANKDNYGKLLQEKRKKHNEAVAIRQSISAEEEKDDKEENGTTIFFIPPVPPVK